MVGIDHQGDAASLHRRMDGVHHLDIVLDTKSDLHLHEAEAAFVVHVRFLDKPRRLALACHPVEPGGIGFDIMPEGPAKKLPDRFAIGLAGNIPERRVDGTDGGHDRPLAAKIA